MVVRKFRCLAGPAGLPDDMISIWEEAISRLNGHPEYSRIYSELHLKPGFMPNDEYSAFIAGFGDDTPTFFVDAGGINK